MQSERVVCMKKIWSLTKNDLFALWRLNKILFILLPLYGVGYAFVGSEISFLSVLAVALGGMIDYNSIANDERSGWNRFVLTTAYSRKDYVLGKYLLALTGVLGGTAILLLSDTAAVAMGRVAPEDRLLSGVPAIVVSTLLLISLALPLSFKYGIEKARILSYLMIGLLCGSAGLLTVFTREQVFSLDMILVNTFLPMLGAAAFILSAFLSVHIYSRKAL